MSSTYGEMIRLSIFGQSHGAAIGMTLDGVPAGLPVDLDKLQAFLNSRAPGQNDWSTPRREEDRPEFLSGIVDGYTCGAPIAAIIRNTNTRSGDYQNLKNCPRPGHADYTAQMKYRGFQDAAGGGHFSGRLTAPLCIAGGLCRQWLENEGVRIGSHISILAGCCDDHFDDLNPEFDKVGSIFPTLDPQAGEDMRNCIAQARADGDSVGGEIECAITGVPAGLGEPMFGSMESRLSQILYGVPAVKRVEFGYGLTFAYDRGSECNDAYTIENGEVRTLTNHNGGILGGITNGMPIIFRTIIKPTPSISKPQQTVNLETDELTELTIKGRHDPCIVPRAVPVIEAAAAIAIFDAWLEYKARR
jgi:chorismate synthase